MLGHSRPPAGAHSARNRFGEPIRPREGEHREAMDRVRAFWELEALGASAPVSEPEHDVTLIHQVLLAHELEQLIRVAPEQWHLLQPNWPSDLATNGSGGARS